MEVCIENQFEKYEKLFDELEDTNDLVDFAIVLDDAQKKGKKLLDKVKAKLQKQGIEELENKNIKYVRYGGEFGNCEVTQKVKFELDNYQKLADVLDDVVLVEDKITRKLEVKYDVESRFKQALIAICKNDYGKHDIDKVLSDLGLDDKAIKLAKKKLKGDYAADKELLYSLGCTGELEEELDAIREQKNMDLIQRYFNLDKLDIAELKKAIYLEDSLSITLNSTKAG